MKHIQDALVCRVQQLQVKVLIKLYSIAFCGVYKC